MGGNFERDRTSIRRSSAWCEGHNSPWVVLGRVAWAGPGGEGANGAPNAPWWMAGVRSYRPGEWWHVAGSQMGPHLHQIDRGWAQGR